MAEPDSDNVIEIVDSSENRPLTPSLQPAANPEAPPYDPVKHLPHIASILEKHRASKAKEDNSKEETEEALPASPQPMPFPNEVPPVESIVKVIDWPLQEQEQSASHNHPQEAQPMEPPAPMEGEQELVVQNDPEPICQVEPV